MSSFKPWKILHIELSEAIPCLHIEPKYQGVYAVFWWHRIPLGHVEISADRLPMPDTQLMNLALQVMTPSVGDRILEQGFKVPLPVTSPASSQDVAPDFQTLVALEEPLKKLQERFSKLVNRSVSVIVCTRNRPEQLMQCLRSLQKLSLPPHEIIIVDNAPTSEVTREIVTQTQGIRYIVEPRPGLSIARNTGIRHSQGEIIAFTDDDAIVHHDWIARLQYGFDDPKVMAVTGLMLPAELATEAQFIFHKGSGGPGWGYRAIDFDTQFFEKMKPRGVPVWRVGAGVNMAFRKQVFEMVGYFDERLGAGASGCSEDSELWYRILAEGWVCRYEPTSVIFHYHRSNFTELKQQCYQYMRGHVVALLVQFANYKHWGNLRRLLVALPKYYVKQFLRELKIGFNPQQTSLFHEIAGCFSGIKFYLKNRHLSAWQVLPNSGNQNLSVDKIQMKV